MKIKLILLGVGFLFLSGCGSKAWNDSELGNISEESISETIHSEEISSVVNSESSILESIEPTTQINPEEVIDLTYFYYNQLEDYEKEMYDVILENVKSFKLESRLKGIDLDSFYKIQTAIVNDHPEIFWMNKYTINTVRDMPVSVKYDYPLEELEDESAQVHIRANRIIDMVPEGSRYDKFKYIYEYIIDSTDYVSNSVYNQDVRSVLMYGESVCAGYAKTFQLLCDKAGIPCIYVSGQTKEGEPHAWNMVEIDGHCFWIDVTWGDPIFEGEGSNSLNYNYFCVDDEILFRTHIIDKGVVSNGYCIPNVFKFPECKDTSYNYYKLNNMYFEIYDRQTIDNYISNKLQNNQFNKILMKFETLEEYQKARGDLFRDGQNDAYIFEIIKKNANSAWKNINYNYTYSDKAYSIELNINISY